MDLTPKKDVLADRYRIAAENALDTIMLVDTDGVAQYVSPSIETVAGYTVGEFEGVDVFCAIHPEDRDEARKAQRKAIQTR